MITLRTGDLNLDHILGSRDGVKCDPEKGQVAPVVLILGAAGTGKTTLALQIASTVACGSTGLRVCFFSLEQSAASLIATSRQFKFQGSFADLAEQDAFERGDGKIHLCHFSPVPVSAEAEESQVFEQRFNELCHVLDEAVKTGGECLFLIDSLNAISTAELDRNEIYRLFTVFRSKGVPVVVTGERTAIRESAGAPSAADAIGEYASFLADIVIELTKEEAAGYQLQYLEVSKSRVSRQVSGRHLYKIRALVDERRGFVVYRSLPSVMSEARYTIKGIQNLKYLLCTEDNKETPQNPLYRLMLNEEIKAGECFSLVGPFGTHKLALGMNLVTGHTITKPRLQRVLLLTFGGFNPVDLDGIACFDFRQHWGAWRTPETDKAEKWIRANFKYDPEKAAKRRLSELKEEEHPSVTQLIFPISYLTPEECLDRLWKETEPEEGQQKYSAALLTDTASICTGFPLLRKDPLFLPAVIDLFRRRGIVSVCIGVQGGEGLNRNMDFALQSSADYRVRLTHYPDFPKLAEIKVNEERKRRRNLDAKLPPGSDLFSEQFVNVVVDNVTGKHYGRKPRWLWVSVHMGRKELHCGYLEDYKPESD